MAWSPTPGTTQSAKVLSGIEELRSLYTWYLSRGWVLSKKYQENIEQYGQSFVASSEQ